MAKLTSPDGIVLLAKKPGLTSFSSLHSVKKALNTTKVGHTGTLDSFAQGLLVVCTGRLTKLAGNITEFDKSYEAIIKFGEETDTLEYTGEIIRRAALPSLSSLNEAIKKYTGNILQAPPAFSAVHVNGKRASDLAREGKSVEIPPRPVSIYSAELTDTALNAEGLVQYCKINFTVSKGTYIRCLARDIAAAAGSAGHLVGLFRTRVGNFDVSEAAGFGELGEFSIENAVAMASAAMSENQQASKNEKKVPYPDDTQLKEEIKEKLRDLDRDTAALCGFASITLKDQQAEKDYCNGKPLRSALFTTNLHDLAPSASYAVFSQNEVFRGLIEKESGGCIRHRFVIN